MNIKFKSSTDKTGMKILLELQKNARTTYSESGKKIGLSSPAVAERIYKMEEAGIINGYHADINPDIFGGGCQASCRLFLKRFGNIAAKPPHDLRRLI
ncbi:MAG: AsnC family transcriptional regulator [Desulfobacula sp.]|nr:AsnC family transcriptional regulator [Desulfobacula sp.]